MNKKIKSLKPQKVIVTTKWYWTVVEILSSPMTFDSFDFHDFLTI